MTITDTLPELIRDAAASVRRAADGQTGDAISPEAFAALVRSCRYMLREARRVHRATEALVDRGAEAKAFRRRCETELSSFDDAVAATAHVRRFADRVPPSKRRDAALAGLEAVERGLSAVRGAYDAYMEVLNLPPAPIDWEQIRQSDEDFACGNFESVADIWARIQAGEEEP